jgi:hypothetical protein
MVWAWFMKVKETEGTTLSDDEKKKLAVTHVNEFTEYCMHLGTSREIDSKHAIYLDKKGVAPTAIVFVLFFLSCKLGLFKVGDDQLHFGLLSATSGHVNPGLKEWAVSVVMAGTDHRPEAYTKSTRGSDFKSLVKVPGLPADQLSEVAQALLSLAGVENGEILERDAGLMDGGVVCEGRPTAYFARLIEYE